MSKDQQRIDADAECIRALGGPAKLADRLGFDKQGGTQRVQNWISRGIPAEIKLAHSILRRPALDARQEKRKEAA